MDISDAWASEMRKSSNNYGRKSSKFKSNKIKVRKRCVALALYLMM